MHWVWRGWNIAFFARRRLESFVVPVIAIMVAIVVRMAPMVVLMMRGVGVDIPCERSRRGIDGKRQDEKRRQSAQTQTDL